MYTFHNITSKHKQNVDSNEEIVRNFRYYDDRCYLSFGFTYIKLDNEQLYKCFIWLNVLAVDSLISNKLKRYLEFNE